MKKEIIVGIIIDRPQIFIDINGNFKGILIEIWNFIEKKLNNKYIFKHVVIDKNNLRIPLKKLQKKIYDIVIGPYWLTDFKDTEALYTYPLLLSSPLVIYNNSIYKDILLKDYIINLIKIWYKPLIIIIIFLGIINIYKKHHNINHNFVESLELFLSEKVFKNMEKQTGFIFVIIIKFFLFIYIYSIVVGKMIEYYYKDNEIGKNIKGKKIYTNRKYYSIIKSHGGIPLVVDNPLKEYQKNQYKKNVIGYAEDSLSVNNTLNNYKYLKVSNAIKTINQISFPINNNNKDFLNDINSIIFDINNKGLSNDFCTNNNINNNEIYC